ncbi:MAG: phosphoribosyltransferase [Steroidobacteraceae bacterium]
MQPFHDRREAGRALARHLHEFEDASDALVLALPRGGVPVGDEIACALHLPLDVLIVRKVGAPGQPELAVGAIASGGAVVWNEELTTLFPAAELQAIAAEERDELIRRETLYRGNRGALQVKGKTVIVVDDGAATGATMRVALQVLRSSGARQIIVALPVASDSAIELLRGEADRVHCMFVPPSFNAVGAWYRDFSPTTDEEVIRLLGRTHTSP